jgi:hypothetical protein
MRLIVAPDMGTSYRAGRRRAPTRLLWFVVGGLIVLVALSVVLGTHDWSSSTHSQRLAGGYVQPGWHGRPQERVRPAEQLWSSEVSLEVGRTYGLDEATAEPREPCTGCFKVEASASGHVVLRAENGIVPWPNGRPSYYDCIRRRESGTEDFVALASATDGRGVPVHGWMCATSRLGSIVRLRYAGEGSGGASYRFDATAWKRPFVD